MRLRARRRLRRRNPQLMIVNPTPYKKKDAEKAFKTFHHVKATKAAKLDLPEGFPKYLTQIGWLDELVVGDEWGNTRHIGRGKKRIYVATDPSMSEVFVGPLTRGSVEILFVYGRATHIKYETPIKSKGIGKLWKHDFDTPAEIVIHGRRAPYWAVLSSETLHVTDRGIEG